MNRQLGPLRWRAVAIQNLSSARLKGSAMTTDFGVRLKQRDGVAVVEAWGDIDVATAGDLARCIDEAFACSADNVRIDMDGIRFADSHAVTALVVASSRAALDGRSLTLRASRPVRRILELTDTAALISLEPAAP
jgi:anti-anti-sigma factor